MIINNNYNSTTSNILSSLKILSEATHLHFVNDDDNKFYPVFIVLTYTGTVFAKLVKFFTDDPYGHTSISFDTNMNKMISFDIKGNGMSTENIMDFCKDGKEDIAKYSIFMYIANSKEYKTMKRYVEEIKNSNSKIEYNTIGVLRLIPGNFLLGKGSDRKDKFFCSEFVASVLNTANKHILNKPSYFFRPSMFSTIRKLIFLKRGLIKNFNSNEIDNIIRDKLSKLYTDIVIR